MTKKGKAKPRMCKVVEINQGLPDAELVVCAPEGYVMKAASGDWFRNIKLILEAARDE